jgi:hypothetical protein
MKVNAVLFLSLMLPLAVCVNTAMSETSPAGAVPELAVWEGNMVKYGEQHCQSGENYYDAVRVYYQIADYTKDPKWTVCAQKALVAYRDGYLKPNGYKAAGWMIFPHGLLQHFQRAGDIQSKEALVMLATNASFARHEVDDYLVRIDGSREVAYNIMSKLLAETVGYSDRGEVQRLVGFAFGHYDKWFMNHRAAYVRPFMVGLTAEALIEYWKRTQDARVLPMLKAGLEWMWGQCWVPDARAFKYTDRDTPQGGMQPAADLNLLIAPAYAWMYTQTKEAVWRERADAIFAGGVALGSGNLSQPKQFNQAYRWSFDYLKWRQ